MLDLTKNIDETVECIHCKNTIPLNDDFCPFCRTPNKRNNSNYSILAQKIVGVILILNGIALAIEEIIIQSSAQEFGNPISNILGAIVIGSLILSGNEKGIKWGRIAICIGAVIFPIIYLAQGDFFMVVFQLIYSSILISLLFWNPGKIRVIVSTGLAVLYFMMEIVGIQAEISGKNVLAEWLLGFSYDLEEVTDNHINGRLFDYSFKLKNTENWSLMSEEDLAIENEDADIWLMNPTYDAHVIIVAETLATDLNAFSDLILFNVESFVPGSQMKDSNSVITQSGLPGKSFDLYANIDGTDIIYRYGLFTHEDCAYQVICFSVENSFDQVKEEFDHMINSFSTGL